jgi:hypothetical protein
MLIRPDGTPVIGAGPLIVRTGFYLHRVPDEVVARNALEDIEAQTETEDYFAAIAFRDGRILLRPATAGMPPIPAEVAEKLIECAKVSNRDLHHDGHWLWAAGDGYLTAIFRDKDGDIWFENTFAETWARLRRMPTVDWVQTLEGCWQEARLRFRGLEIKPEQLTTESARGISLLH